MYSEQLSQDERFPVPWTPRDVVRGVIASGIVLLLFLLLGDLVQRWEIPLDPGLMVTLGTLVLLLPVWYLTIYQYGVRWTDLGLRAFPLSVLGTGLLLFTLFFIFNIIYAAFLALFGLQIQPDVIGPLFEGDTFSGPACFWGDHRCPVGGGDFLSRLYFSRPASQMGLEDRTRT